MEVRLAGMNVPLRVIEEVLAYVPEDKREEFRNRLSPEALSAAYARISRSEKDVNELEVEASNNMNNARKSAEIIIYGMGHHSVADHALFNFNITGASRLLIESIEKRRLSGYTEKSQRYVTLKGDYVKPKEFSEEDLKKFDKLVQLQNNFYFKCKDKIFENLKEKFMNDIEKSDGKAKESYITNLEGKAKEDARYSLSLATEAQLGCSYPGQTLELAIRELRHGELQEERDFAKLLYDSVVGRAPSLIQLTDPELFKKHNPGKELDENNFKYTRNNLKELVKKTFCGYKSSGYLEMIMSKGSLSCSREENVALMEDNNIDRMIVAAILHSNSKKPIEGCYSAALNMPSSTGFIKEALKYIGTYDKVPREFEIMSPFYEITLSSSCFAQLKRHRMDTLLPQDYNPALGYEIPESIQEVGLGKDLENVCDESGSLYHEFSHKYGKAAEYCLTNAHRRRVLFCENERQHYHISRTREESHAQWEIRNTVENMSKLIKKIAPTTTILLGGKDKFAEIRKSVYGE